jgi:hypothetical protein
MSAAKREVRWLWPSAGRAVVGAPRSMPSSACMPRP